MDLCARLQGSEMGRGLSADFREQCEVDEEEENNAWEGKKPVCAVQI
uniref:Uncharacterized protein n=1 Tax=Arundo donax TaxID=35708 RepID=A0A0A9FQB1_ARUDO